MAYEISMPFVVGEDGQVNTTSDPDQQVKQHVLSLANTDHYVRVMLSNYGMNQSSLVFEDADTQQVAVLAGQLASQALAAWEPGVELLNVTPVVDPLSDEISRVDILYERKDSPDSGQTANTNTAIIGADGTVKEVIRG